MAASLKSEDVLSQGILTLFVYIDCGSHALKMENIMNWVLPSVGCIGFLLNLVIIIKFIKKAQRKRKKLDFMIVNLALADICFCLGIVAAFTLKLSKLDISEKYLLIYWNISQGLSFTASLLHIILISVDRLIGVVYPLLYKSGYITSFQLKMVLAALWLTSCFIASTQFWLELIVIDIIVSALIFIAFLTVTVIYIIIAKSIFKNAEELTEIVNQHEILARRKVHGICTCFLLAISFFACNIPFVISNVYYDIEGKEWSFQMAYVNFFLLTINCTLDPIFYYLRPTLAKWLKNLLLIIKPKRARVSSV